MEKEEKNKGIIEQLRKYLENEINLTVETKTFSENEVSFRSSKLCFNLKMRFEKVNAVTVLHFFLEDILYKNEYNKTHHKIDACENVKGTKILKGISNSLRLFRDYIQSINETNQYEQYSIGSTSLDDASEKYFDCKQTAYKRFKIDLRIISTIQYYMTWYSRYGFYSNKKTLHDAILHNKEILDTNKEMEIKSILEKNNLQNDEHVNQFKTYGELGRFLISQISSCNETYIKLFEYLLFKTDVYKKFIGTTGSFDFTSNDSFPISADNIIREFAPPHPNKKRSRSKSNSSKPKSKSNAKTKRLKPGNGNASGESPTSQQQVSSTKNDSLLISTLRKEFKGQLDIVEHKTVRPPENIGDYPHTYIYGYSCENNTTCECFGLKVAVDTGDVHVDHVKHTYGKDCNLSGNRIVQGLVHAFRTVRSHQSGSGANLKVTMFDASKFLVIPPNNYIVLWVFNILLHGESWYCRLGFRTPKYEEERAFNEQISTAVIVKKSRTTFNKINAILNADEHITDNTTFRDLARAADAVWKNKDSSLETKRRWYNAYLVVEDYVMTSKPKKIKYEYYSLYLP